MTFLNTRYRLSRPLTTQDYERLNRLLILYGIRQVSVEDQDLVVEYDASRIHEAEVLAAVRNAGIAVAPPHPIPAGAFDYAGAFKDDAWPVQGLSPVNQKN